MRYGKPIKNKGKRRDPRYFLNENIDMDHHNQGGDTLVDCGQLRDTPAGNAWTQEDAQNAYFSWAHEHDTDIPQTPEEVKSLKAYCLVSVEAGAENEIMAVDVHNRNWDLRTWNPDETQDWP
tara:strand:+ start:2620 stop:2985 length:366 start_codon:yes stop_codon:yes gene_type:complete